MELYAQNQHGPGQLDINQELKDLRFAQTAEEGLLSKVSHHVADALSGSVWGNYGVLMHSRPMMRGKAD